MCWADDLMYVALATQRVGGVKGFCRSGSSSAGAAWIMKLLEDARYVRVCKLNATWTVVSTRCEIICWRQWSSSLVEFFPSIQWNRTGCWMLRVNILTIIVFCDSIVCGESVNVMNFPLLTFKAWPWGGHTSSRPLRCIQCLIKVFLSDESLLRPQPWH